MRASAAHRGAARPPRRRARVPAVRELREPLELGEGQPQRLADVADRTTRAIRREARDERGVLAAVALGDADDQLLADVAREVEVDVRHRGELAVEEATEREVGRDRVDVREAGQVADERPDRRAAPATGRQHVPHRARAAHLEGDLARELEHLPVQQEEAGEAELVDQRELLLEPLAHASLVTVEPASSARRTRARRHGSAARSRDRPVGEVGVAVAELLRQVERQPLGQLGGSGDRVRSSGNRSRISAGAASTHSWLPRRSRSQPSSEVRQRTATSTSWSAARRASCACTSPVATVATFSCSARSRRRGVAARVAPFVRTLQLDVEAIATEGLREPRGRAGVADCEPVRARSRRGRRAPRSAPRAARPRARAVRAPGSPSAACPRARR